MNFMSNIFPWKIFYFFKTVPGEFLILEKFVKNLYNGSFQC
jgi:hypothetical protein